MSSPTVLFVLEKIMHALKAGEPAKIFGAAFGPGSPWKHSFCHHDKSLIREATRKN